MIKNMEASIRDRLLNIAKKSNRDFNAVLLQYFQERFLYRLSISPYDNNLILKGALLFMVNKIPMERPTKDIDFLGYHFSNNEENVIETIRNIISIDSDDGVTFDTNSITVETITQESKYNGYRVHFVGKLGQARKKLQIDIGFGDKIIPNSFKMDFPTFLDQPAPKIEVYSIESAIAEKLEAIVRFNYLTSRIKDFYDIWYLSHQFKFKGKLLRKAILITFENRNTDLEDIKIVFRKDFINSDTKQKQWQAFLKRNRLNLDINFKNCLQDIKVFIKPIVDQNNNKKLLWSPSDYDWNKNN